MEQLLADSDCVAVNLHQELAPIGGWQVPVQPPVKSTAANAGDTPYALNGLRDGTAMVSLDSVACQAHRMAAVFHGALAGYVPKVELNRGEHTIPVTALPGGLANPAMRTSDLGEAITAAFAAYAEGDPLPIAGLSPTALIHGAIDTQHTGVTIPRLIRSEIQAWDVDPLTEPAPIGDPRDADPSALVPDGAQNAGQAPLEDPGGVIVHGRIQQTATLHMEGLRGLEEAHGGLATYALGLALGGLWRGGLEYHLREGCELVRAAAPSIEAVYRDSRRTGATLSGSEIGKALLSASAGARQLELPIGERRVATADASTTSD